MDLNKALQLPFKDRENAIRFFIGGLLNILPVVNLIPTGYAFLTMRNHITGEPIEDLPAWDNWGTLFKYGFLFFIASLGYALIPLFILGLGVLALHPHVGILTFLGVTLIVVGIVCLIGIILLFPMGMVVFAIDDEFSSFFSFFRIIDLILKHLGAYLRAFLILFVMGIVLGFLSYIPVVGWLIGVFVGFYLMLQTAFFMGDVGREIVGNETGIAPSQEENMAPASTTATPPSETPPEAASEEISEEENDKKA